MSTVLLVPVVKRWFEGIPNQLYGYRSSIELDPRYYVRTCKIYLLNGSKQIALRVDDWISPF